jgi:drug/metabolite transporter (DMT)-like permease
MIIAGLIMIGVYRWSQLRGKIPQWTRRDIGILVFLGIMGVGLNQLFFVLGISKTTVSHAAIMIGLTPVTVLLLASAMSLEKLSVPRLLGMFIALAGVAVLQWSSNTSDGASITGDALVYLASLTFAIFTVRSGLAMLPIVFSYSRGFDFTVVSWVGWVSLAYMAVFASVVCYLIYYYALSHVPASRVSAFSYLQPLLSTVMAISVLDEHPTKSLLSGGALVLAGVFLAERG